MNFFSEGDFMPHGHCYLWNSHLLLLNVVSDTLIALAYFSIPFTLVHFVRKRTDLEFNWIFSMFALFIVACGSSHLMEVWVIWHPTYWLSGTVKAITAIASVPTAVMLAKLVPQALRIPSPAALRHANQELHRQIGERILAEENVRRLNENLEQRVLERTELLQQSQQLLQAIVNNSEAVIYAKDLQGRYILVNQQFTDIFKVDAVGRTDQEIFNPSIASAFNALDEAVASVGQAVTQEEVAPHDDGQHTYISVKCPLRDSAGEVYGVCGISTDITERKRTEKALQDSLAEKEVMIQEIHHRVKNNLQVINSLIQLQSNTLNDPSVIAALQDCQARVRSMALVHERLYKSGSFVRMDFGSHLRELAHLVANSYTASESKVELEFRLQPVELSLESAIPMGLIANELISNAFKHAFDGRKSGKLEILLSNGADDEIIMRVDDDGPGLPPDFALDNPSSTLGLQMIKTLARQIRGQFSAESSALGGVRFTLRVKLTQHTK